MSISFLCMTPSQFLCLNKSANKIWEACPTCDLDSKCSCNWESCCPCDWKSFFYTSCKTKGFSGNHLPAQTTSRLMGQCLLKNSGSVNRMGRSVSFRSLSNAFLPSASQHRPTIFFQGCDLSPRAAWYFFQAFLSVGRSIKVILPRLSRVRNKSNRRGN